MAGVDTSFLSFTRDQLLRLLKEHRLSPPVHSRLHYIHSLALYFLDHVSRICVADNSLLAMENTLSGIAYRRATAKDFVSESILCGLTTCMHKDIQAELQHRFAKAKQSCIKQTIEFYSKTIRRDASPNLVALFFVLQQQRECIPDVFEM